MMFTNEELLDFLAKEGFTDKTGYGVFAKKINDDYLNLEIEDTINPAKKRAIFSYVFELDYNLWHVPQTEDATMRFYIMNELNLLFRDVKLCSQNHTTATEAFRCSYTTMVVDIEDLKAEIQNAFTLTTSVARYFNRDSSYWFFRNIEKRRNIYCHKNMDKPWFDYTDEDDDNDDTDEEDYAFGEEDIDDENAPF